MRPTRRRVALAVALLAAAAAPTPTTTTVTTVTLSSLDLSVARQGWGTPGVDRSVGGHPLTVGGHAYRTGLGTHCPGRLTVRLDGGSRRFHAVVGIDDEVPPGTGAADFSVWGDGRRLWDGGLRHRGDPPQSVDVDVVGVRELQLHADDPDGWANDHADWCDAAVDVTGEPPRTAAAGRVPDPFIAPPSDDPHLPSPPAAGVASVPPLGWNSYDGYGDSVTEAEVRANAAAVAAHLRPHGWQYVVVDYRWYDPGAHDNDANARRGATLTMDAFGRLQPSPNRFPSAAGGAGFRPLADAVHRAGLKFGIHVMRGIARQAVAANLPIEGGGGGGGFRAADAADPASTCPWCPDMVGVRGNTPAGRAWYASVVRQYAAWGVDLIKVDDLSAPYRGDEVAAIRAAIDAAGRPVVFSTSPGPAPLGRAADLARLANQWRANDDLWDTWADADGWTGLGRSFDAADRWDGSVGPGHWPDLDMLPLGRLSVGHRSVGPDRRTRLTRAEQLTMLTLWAVFPSPLMVGGDLTAADDWEWSLLANDEVLTVNQDPLGRPAQRVVNRGGDRQAWCRPLADGSVAVALFNATDVDDTTVTATWRDLDLFGRYRVRDLWRHADVEAASDHVAAVLPPHGAALLRLTPEAARR